LYVNVNVDPLAGVTVRLFGAEFPPLTNVPRLPPSEIVTLRKPLNVPPFKVTVHELEAVRKYPFAAQEPPKDRDATVTAMLVGAGSAPE
jgi:hypothetical protein